MELIAKLDQQLQDLHDKSLIRKRRSVETACAPRMMVDGRGLLAFCSNDYLGLAAHPRVAEAMHQGIELYGAGRPR
jgi:8-amino-7-oxononanoate synthase